MGHSLEIDLGELEILSVQFHLKIKCVHARVGAPLKIKMQLRDPPYTNLEVTLHTVHRRVVNDLAESRVLGREIDGVRVEDHVEHHTAHVLLIKVIARWYQRIRDRPL